MAGNDGLKFERIPGTDRYNLYIDGEMLGHELTLDMVMSIISMRFDESKDN